MKKYIIILSSIVILGLILGISGAIYNEQKLNAPPDSTNVVEESSNEINQELESSNQEVDAPTVDESFDFRQFLDCWSGDYAGGKRTIYICFEKIDGSDVEGYDYLILPSGEQRPTTYFKGKVTKDNKNDIIFELRELGEGKIGRFVITFNASDQTEGTGYWYSNDGKLTRDLSITRVYQGD